MATRKSSSRKSALALIVGLLLAMPASAQDAKPGVLPLRATGKGPTHRIGRGAFTPDGKTFFSAGVDQTIRALDPADGKELFVLEGQKAEIRALGLAGDRLLISAGENGTIFLWDVADRKKIGELPRHKHALQRLAVSHDGKVLATGGGDWTQGVPGELRLWDLEKREELGVLAGHRRPLLALAFSPDDRLLAAADHSGDVRVWDLRTRKPVVTLFQDRPVAGLHFTPDGKRLATGDYGGRITIWDTTDWYDEAFVDTPGNGVMSLCAAPAGTMLAAAYANGDVKLWDWARLEEQPPLHVSRHKVRAWQVAFSPDGKTLATAGEDNLVHFWSIPPNLAKRFTLAAPVKSAVEVKPARPGPARVAVLAAGTGPAGIVQELAIAKLSDEKGLILLDRSAIARLLAEQKLSLSGLVDAATAVRAGKILAVDVLGIVEVSADGKQNLGLVVFDAATGVRLLDAGFGAPDADQQAREVALGMRTAIEKWRRGAKSLTTVCFLPVRNADLPRSLDAFCEAISAALERQLLHHPAVVALERKRLEGIAQEKLLSAEGATRELLASVLLVELEIARAREGGGVRGTVTIKDNAGKTLHKIAHEVADPDGANLLGPLVERVQAALHTAQGQAIVKRSREARRFLREAEVLWKHGHYLQGLRAAEAAHALAPDEPARRRLSEYLARYALEMWTPGILASYQRNFKGLELTPEQARHGLDLVRRADQLVDPVKGWANSLWLYPDLAVLNDQGGCYQAQHAFLYELKFVKLKPADADVERAIRELRIAGVRRNVERIKEMANRVGADPKALSRLQYLLAVFSDDLHEIALDPSVQMDAVLDMLRVWLDVSGRFSADAYPLVQTQFFIERGLIMLYHSSSPKETYTTADRERTLSFFQAAEKHPHPALRLAMAHYHNRQLLKLGRLNAAEAANRQRLLEQEAKDMIDKAPFKAPAAHRVALYAFLNHVLQYPENIYDTKANIEAYFALADFMLQRKDVVAWAWVQAAHAGVQDKSYHPRTLNLIQRMEEVYDAPTHRVFDDAGKTMTIRKEIERARWTLLKISPQLDKKAAPPPWDRVLTLAEVAKLKNVNTLMKPVQHDAHVYLIASGTDPEKDNKPYLQLIRAALDGSPLKTLGKAYVTLKDYDPKNPNDAFADLNRFVAHATIYDGRFFAGTVSDGIYAFALTGGDGVHIGEKQGLPSLGVMSLAGLDGQLFAGLDGGFLIAYDLSSERCNVIASSRRTERRSPLDDGKPFGATGIVADPARHRVLFHAIVLSGNLKDPGNGRWEYNLKTGQFKKLLPMVFAQASQMQDQAIFLMGSEWDQTGEHPWFARYDLPTDRFTLLEGKTPEGIEAQKPAGVPPGLSAVLRDRTYHAGYIWQANPFGRRPIQGGAPEFFQKVTGKRGFDAWYGDCLQGVGANELLLCDGKGLYLVRLK